MRSRSCCALFLALVLIQPNLSATPPGGIIRDESIFIPAAYVSSFFNCSAPDSARIQFNRRLPFLASVQDTSSRLYRFLVKKNNLKSLQDYRQFLNEAKALDHDYSFQLFYKMGVEGKHHKLRVHTSLGKLKRELVFTNPIQRLIQETSYFENGNMRMEAQYRLRDTSSLAIKNWFQGAYLREGRKAGYYISGSLRYLESYREGRRVDTAFHYDQEGNLVAKEVWRADSMILRLEQSLAGKQANAKNSGKIASPKRKALLVGVDKYSYPEYKSRQVVDSTVHQFMDLGGCENDVQLLASTLEKYQGFQRAEIRTVLGEGSTRQGLLNTIKSFLDNLRAGDQVFLHFSGSGYTAPKPGSENEREFVFACRDASLGRYVKGHDGLVRRSELELLFNTIRKKVGVNGQVIISIDACETGETSAGTSNASVEMDLRGETSDMLLNSIRRDGAAMALFTAATGKELSWEMKDPSNKNFGVYSYWLANALQDPGIHTTQELYDALYSLMENHFYGEYASGSSAAMRQRPTYTANEDFPIFDAGTQNTASALPEVKKTGNAFVLSIGISQYNISPANTRLKFSNCVADARSYDEFFRSQFTNVEGNRQYNSFLLTDSAATYKNIMQAINNIIFNSRPEDYFILNFSGYCRQLTDSAGKRVTYFVPYGPRNIADTNEIKTKGVGIPLGQLKDLLQLIPANNQLFITEAGSTNDFQKEFIQALIETSPTIAALSNKNRIFMVPRSSGIDRFTCNQAVIDHGPLNYYITGLDKTLNVFGVFQDGLYADAVKYSLNRAEVECDFSRTGYFDIFFEREYIKDLQYFLPPEISQSRGLGVNREARAALAVGNSKKYALVVGTDKYTGKPDWSDLKNPVLDAKDIAAELRTGFGYNVKLLLDAPIDSIYAHISWLSQNLRKNDQLIIYIAGHGDFDSALLDDGFIVCRDSKPVSQDPYRNSYIQYSKFSRMINRLPANQILMALDVCFGGTFDERVARNQGRERTTDYDNLSNISFYAEKLKKKTRLYLTSGGKDVVPDGLDKKHSPFALRLLQALQGRGGASKMLTAKNLHQFVERLPSGPLLGSFGDDEVGSEFILISE